MSPHQPLRALLAFPFLALAILSVTTRSGFADPLFDEAAIRDISSLEIRVLSDWQVSPRDPEVRQKLVEITVCEWWPGQRVRLPVTFNAPAKQGPCRNLVIANQGLGKRVTLPAGDQLALLKEHGVGVVLIGMGTIDAMEPVGELHHGMGEHLLETKDPRYSPAWIWGMSQMRALTAALSEPRVFRPEKVLATGGSKRGVATAVAGIHDDRFTAILPVVAPPLGNPGTPSCVIGLEPEAILEADRDFYEDLAAGRLGIDPKARIALEERAVRRANQRVTLAQAEAAGWTEKEAKEVTDRTWDPSRITDHLAELDRRGLEYVYLVGTNDSVSPALLELGRRFPGFPLCIIPGGQHGGPATAGFTRQVPKQPEAGELFRAFALHHFFGSRGRVETPRVEGRWEESSRTLTVLAEFPDGSEPSRNVLWWNLDRSEPYTLPFEYDEWNSADMEKVGAATYRAAVVLDRVPERLDFVTRHDHVENGITLPLSGPYRRVLPAE